MIFYIICLRALAACLITNSHYSGIYPISSLAAGGLLGDCLFFAISGYCLYNIKLPFKEWYLKRILRIYPACMLTTIFLILFNYHKAFNFNSLSDYIGYFVYPTTYHFVASLMILYAVFFVSMSIKIIKQNIEKTIYCITALVFIIYMYQYDTSYYHIDTVEEPMIRFLFFISMLVGAYFRQKDVLFRNNKKFIYQKLATTLFIAFLYFLSKLALVKGLITAQYQIFNQVLIVFLLISIFIIFSALDSKLELIPNKYKRFITLVSTLTLEIYVVQHFIIAKLNFISFFPLNWVIISISILLVALMLHAFINYTTTFLTIKCNKI